MEPEPTDIYRLFTSIMTHVLCYYYHPMQFTDPFIQYRAFRASYNQTGCGRH